MSQSHQVSAGLLMYRIQQHGLQVFLAHPGGPYFKNKDDGCWGIPKGLIDPGEDHLAAAVREFEEETGLKIDDGFIPLGSARQKSGKLVHAWGFEGDWPEGKIPECNTFEIEWPPRTGERIEIPEIDRACFFDLQKAYAKMAPSQQPFIERLIAHLREQGHTVRKDGCVE
ncbi:MAG: NUDIX domain-containing protein [Candidatus Omnitrophota bacterium]